MLSLGSVPGQPLCEQVEVDATMVVQDMWTAHQNALNCKTVDINTYVRYESGNIHGSGWPMASPWLLWQWDTLVLLVIDGSTFLPGASKVIQLPGSEGNY